MVNPHHPLRAGVRGTPWTAGSLIEASKPEPCAYPLSPRAERWLERLPDGVRIDRTRAECPEVLDRLACHWDDPCELARLFNEILFESESARARLRPSFAVLLEIAALRQHAARDLHRWRASVWDEALDAL